MRLICWNCNGAFRKKFKLLSLYKADIIVCSESESPEKMGLYRQYIPLTSQVWIGNCPTKGLGVYTFNGYQAEIAPFYDPKYQYILPLIITDPTGKSFLLIAVWTQSTRKTYEGYIVQAFRALEVYAPYITAQTIIAGDFNSNKHWDNDGRRAKKHSHLIELLFRHNFISLYHYFSRENQGCETHPTIYMHKDISKPYHIDYIFAAFKSLPKIKSFSIGDYQNWIYASDHMPMFLELM